MNKLNDLKLWNKAIELTLEVYNTTVTFPKEEMYGLISQIRRCAVSVPSNIAEGAGRNTANEFIHFLGVSNGSSFELQTQLIIASRLGYLRAEYLNQMLNSLDEIQKMNYALQKSLRKA